MATAELYYQAETLTVPSGTTPTSNYKVRITMENGYEYCTGVVLYTQSATVTLNVGLADQNNNTIHDTVHYLDFVYDGGGWDNRYKPIEFGAKGRYVEVLLTPWSTLGADQVIQMVFRLENQKRDTSMKGVFPKC